MVKKQISKKQFTIYLIVAFGLAWILQIVASIFVNKGNEIVFRGILAGCMYMPFLGVLVARIPLKGMGWVPHLKGRIRYIFFSLWMPVLLSVIGGVLFFVILPKVFDPEFTSLRMQMEQAGALQQLEEQGLTIPIYLVITFVQAITFAPFINMLVALGEEVGWRGFLLWHQVDKYGAKKAVLINGVEWGLAHMPLIYLGFNYSNDNPGAPWSNMALMMLLCIVMGITFSFVTLKTGNCMYAAIMHGVVNVIGEIPVFCSVSLKSGLLGPNPTGLVSMSFLIILAVILFVRLSKLKISSNEK